MFVVWPYNYTTRLITSLWHVSWSISIFHLSFRLEIMVFLSCRVCLVDSVHNGQYLPGNYCVTDSLSCKVHAHTFLVERLFVDECFGLVLLWKPSVELEKRIISSSKCSLSQSIFREEENIFLPCMHEIVLMMNWIHAYVSEWVS